MINGQGVDVDIVFVVLAVHDAAHILGHQRLIADDDPFGKRFRPARISHLAGILNMQNRIRFGRRMFLIPGLKILETVAHGRLAGALSRPDPGLHRRHIVQDILHQIIKGVLHNKDLALRMIDAIGNVLPPQEVIDGQINRPDLGTSEPGQNMIDGIMRQNRHTVVLLHTKIQEGICGTVASIFQLTIS